MRIRGARRIRFGTNFVRVIHIDIHRSLNNIIIKLFSEDTNCFLSGDDFSSLERLTETELNKLQTWINANNLTINYDPKKSSYYIFKPRNNGFPPNYNSGLKIVVYKYTLKFKETTKYLDVFIGQQIKIGKSYSRHE